MGVIVDLLRDDMRLPTEHHQTSCRLMNGSDIIFAKERHETSDRPASDFQ